MSVVFFFYKDNDEFDNLAGACPGFGTGRFRAMLYPKAWKKMISAMTNLPDKFYVVLAVDLWLRALWSTTC